MNEITLLTEKELEAGSCTATHNGYLLEVVAPHDPRECAECHRFIIPDSCNAEQILRGFIHSGYTATITEVPIRRSFYQEYNQNSRPADVGNMPIMGCR